MAIDYGSKIPNNVDLAGDKQLQRALEQWQPRYLEWWKEMGPIESRSWDVYLRTAISVDPKGWAHFDYVKMPDYRWGIFLAPPENDRKIAFGKHKGQPVWNEVPGEYRSVLRRIIVTQGDTEPASVEQQRHLGMTAPSLYDLRNLYQVNVEEGRHLWAMVYLLHAYFGRDGREEGDELLARRSGDENKPRILGAFNEKTPDWLSFFMFTFLTDRDGKYQLAALAESGFDPLARSTRFMLTEEAHHLFVGESGIGRILSRTAELMKKHDVEEPDRVRALGAIDLETIQRYLSFHFSVTLDLYGSEISSNAASFYDAGLKGRFEEEKIDDDHQLSTTSYATLALDGDRLVKKDENALMTLNERLRDDYIADCQAGVDRWNKILEKAGVRQRLRLPHKAFHRKIGTFSKAHVTPDGDVVSESAWKSKESEWLPTEADNQFIRSIMGRVTDPGKYASWIAPPLRGIDNKGTDFEYVRFG
ncbi:MAG: benzoyl-CoA 2,3-epoxidase subunit BoxB [Deltaproteobacteria bacterium]|nr:benzoyl-CoA 2,3-epoxidase subunit BoxB [Deltaproteobacteria bacterium]